MFKKIVSQLPFSPSLIKELGFYAKRLQKEELTRRLGLILTAFALVVQSFTLFSPPESANAAHSADILYGGVHSKAQLLAAYDQNRQGFRDLCDYAGISRQNLADTERPSYPLNSRRNGQDAGWRSWWRKGVLGPNRGETVHYIKGMEIHMVPLSNFDKIHTTGRGSRYTGYFKGSNQRGQRFIIMKDCGNIVMLADPPRPKDIKVCRLADKSFPVIIKDSEFNPQLHSKNPEDCQPPCTIPGKTNLKKNDPNCKEDPKCAIPGKTHLKRDDPNCKEDPKATCNGITVKKLSETKVQLTGTADLTHGATVSEYTFIIKDRTGKEVQRKTVKSGATSTSITMSLKEGSYTAELILTTSLGKKTSKECKTPFTVSIAKCPVNPALAASDPNCQTCVGDPALWFKDADCKAKIVRTKKAKNLQTGKDATIESVKAGERIEYTLTMKNEGKDVATFDAKDELYDVLEYATMYDQGGGDFNKETKTISWKKITLKPGESQTRTFTVQMPSTIPAKPQGQSQPMSYDCRMINTFGNTVSIDVDCPAPKVVETVVAELPHTGATENMIFAGVFFAIVTFFYARSRQLNKEVRLIRKQTATGTF